MQLDRIIIAVEKMDAMVRFYNAVFNASLEPVGPPLVPQFHMGKLAGIQLLLCPNIVSQIVADQNRQQFRFVVDDLEETLSQVVMHGGCTLEDSITNGSLKAAGVTDPDGNTIEFVQYPKEIAS